MRARTISRLKYTGAWTPLTGDVVIVVALTAVVQQNVWFLNAPDATVADRPLSSALLLIGTTALLWRRRAPVTMAATLSGVQLLQTLLSGVFSLGPGLALTRLVALYSVGAHAEPRRAAAGAALISADIYLQGVVAQESAPDDGPYSALFYWLLILSVFGLGVLVRGRRGTAALRARAEVLDEQRAGHAREAVAEERRRIARELHDVVSHNISASVLQAEAAQAMLTTQPERADHALQTIQSMGREALGEMRRMLGILRADPAGGASAPQPRLSELPALIARTRESGLPAELTVKGTPRDLAPGTELSAYRIVQEAITNTRRHAGPARVHVSVRYADRRLEVQVTDDGRGVASGGDDGTGHGLVGMRERVEFFGGDFTAESPPGGGFTVIARFPIATPSQ